MIIEAPTHIIYWKCFEARRTAGYTLAFLVSWCFDNTLIVVNLYPKIRPTVLPHGGPSSTKVM